MRLQKVPARSDQQRQQRRIGHLLLRWERQQHQVVLGFRHRSWHQRLAVEKRAEHLKMAWKSFVFWGKFNFHSQNLALAKTSPLSFQN